MKKKILLAEDEHELSNLIKMLLEGHNYEVIVAYDGQEALDKVVEKPDLIILDLMMPKLSGQQVIEKIKANQQTKYIPVIILTAKGDSQTIFELMDAGSFDYLIKPFDHNELLAIISRALVISSQP